MGPRTAEAQRQVAEQRRRIGHSLDVAESEVREDVHDAKERVGEIADDVQDRLESRIESLPGMSVVHDQIERHPMTSVLAGFGLGIAVGMVVDSFGSDTDNEEERERRAAKKRRSNKAKRNRSNRDRNHGQSNMLRMFAGPALGMIGEPLRRELSTMLREGISSMLGRDTEEHRPAHMAASRRDDDDESDGERRERRGAA